VIDVRRLNVLRAVVETGSVAAAAELLSYTPSAVSQQCEHTSRVLAAVQDAEDALAAWRSGRTGRLRLAAFPPARRLGRCRRSGPAPFAGRAGK
jgi:DNA-binding transcriptional LysR family regulator